VKRLKNVDKEELMWLCVLEKDAESI